MMDKDIQLLLIFISIISISGIFFILRNYIHHEIKKRTRFEAKKEIARILEGLKN